MLDVTIPYISNFLSVIIFIAHLVKIALVKSVTIGRFAIIRYRFHIPLLIVIIVILPHAENLPTHRYFHQRHLPLAKKLRLDAQLRWLHVRCSPNKIKVNVHINTLK